MAAACIHYSSVVFAQNPIHVTYLWHMHQPIYYPYESVQATDNANRFVFSVAGVHGERSGNYGDWPKNAVQQGADRGLPNAGVQVSFSGSLMENLNGLWGTGWRDHWRWARNGLRTVRDNPRLDLVGFAYHHSLMPLTSYESMRMQIKLHKEAYKDNWNTGGSYSKGFFPPESSFALHMIPALVEEGIEWVMVDSGHFDRTLEDFPWSPASSIRPNRSEFRNGTAANKASQWVQLQNVWAPTPVAAPFSYQPHRVRYVDPHSDPANPTVKSMIAVPAARYEGNENGRGGYGAFKPENVWGSNVDKNNNPQRPMIILCHSDGDNFGMKNADAFHGQHGLFLNMIQSNPNFSHTTVQDYLELYPVPANDFIHVEAGSWIGIDGGTPYFDKWIENNARDGQHPDYWSWSMIIAAQNRVLHAEDLENNYSINDVRWGIGPDTAKAWRYFLQAETSCHWYWDYDTANPWDGNATRGANLAMTEANKVINRHPGVDRVGPAIFHPQRKIWNPGGKHWNEAQNQPSDFDVWTFVDDVSGVASVTLKWRTADFNSYKNLSNYAHELYAHTPGQNSAWNAVPMTGDWYPTGKGPNVPDPINRAMRYTGRVQGASDTLVSYYIEAVDTRGNTNKTHILHVWVGESTGGGGGNEPRVEFDPPAPNGCEPVTIKYRKSTSMLGAGPIHIHIGRNGWFDLVPGNPQMTDSGDFWTYVYNIPNETETINIVFNNGSGSWDNNGGQNWNLAVANCATGGGSSVSTFWTSPAQLYGCGPITIYYNPVNRPLAGAAQVYIHAGRNGWQDVILPNPAMSLQNGIWSYTYTPEPGTEAINVVFNNGEAIWDNNANLDWVINVGGCYGEEECAGEGVVWIVPENPTGCDPITVYYNPGAGGTLVNSGSGVKIHIGRDDGSGRWQDVLDPPPGMTLLICPSLATTVYYYVYSPPPGTREINFAFSSINHVDNNNGLDWHYPVNGCAAIPTGFAITNPASNTLVDSSVSNHVVQGIASGVAGHLTWTNNLTGGSGMLPVSSPWTIPQVALGIGTNVITVSGTNTLPGGVVTSAHDSAANYGAGWTNGSNGGTGFGAWALESNGTAGHFTAAKGWGFWSHEGDNYSAAVRPFTGALVAGQTVHIRMKNGWIWEQGGSVGVALRDSDGHEKWVLYFSGGASTYAGTHATDIGWTDAGLDIAFSLTSATHYAVTITPVGGTARTYTGSFTGHIHNVRAWSFGNGTGDEFNSNRDYFVNNLMITSTGSGGSSTTSATVTIVRQAVGHGDSNGDGIPDTWYQQHGVDPSTPGRADQNIPNGNMTYRMAYLYDLDPNNPPAVNPNTIHHAALDGAMMQVRVEAPTSPNRRYDVYWTTNLADPVWMPMGHNLPGRVDQAPVVFTVTNGPDVRYYRTGARLP
ncbi:MAG TPA: carbohydrate-binding protein [Kiritimatiellia bacterium]|nr:carbohydrate-binding protein [Kiritimatiellia bacterium]HMP97848.1 carbohydrate-binding protein [Kiritimatiellia bacterium]